MTNKLMISYFGIDFIFALTGALLLGFSLTSEQGMRSSPTTDNVAKDLLLDQCPLTGTPCPSAVQALGALLPC
jgi:hypothetical protein